MRIARIVEEILLDYSKGLVTKDLAITPKYVVNLVNETRAFLIKQRFLDKSITPTAFFTQTINIELTPNKSKTYQRCSSVKEIPAIISGYKNDTDFSVIRIESELGKTYNLYTDYDSQYIKFSLVGQDLPYCRLHNNKLIFENNINLNKVYLTAVFDNPINAYLFNNNLFDYYEFDKYPLTEEFLFPLKELIVNKLAKDYKNNVQDNNNDGLDNINKQQQQ